MSQLGREKTFRNYLISTAPKGDAIVWAAGGRGKTRVCVNPGIILQPNSSYLLKRFGVFFKEEGERRLRCENQKQTIWSQTPPSVFSIPLTGLQDSSLASDTAGLGPW